MSSLIFSVSSTPAWLLIWPSAWSWASPLTGSPSPAAAARDLPDFFSSLPASLRPRSVLGVDLGWGDFRRAGFVAGIFDLVLGICSGPKNWAQKRAGKYVGCVPARQAMKQKPNRRARSRHFAFV